MKTIAIDFDGTITDKDNYPDLGAPSTHARFTINRLIECGNEVIIWSCRDSNEIERYLYEQGIKFTAINENTPHLIKKWGNDPRKVGADIFIDDKNLYCQRVNWLEIYGELMMRGLIKGYM